MATYKSFADLTEQQKQQFGDEDSYKQFMDTNVLEQNPIQQQQQPSTENTLTDPSDFAQAQVGAAVRQPTLPQGGAVLPNLALQSVTPNQLQTTPGLTGTVAAATPTATTAPMVQGAAVPSAAQVTQASVPAANTYDYTATTTAGQLPQATAAQGTCLLYTSPSPRDGLLSRMPSSA